MAIVVGKAELILICLVASFCWRSLPERFEFLYPILLTCGGVLLALVPGLPRFSSSLSSFSICFFRHCFIRRRCSGPGEISGRTFGQFSFWRSCWFC